MKLHISNSTKRDATIVATSTPAKPAPAPAKDGKPVTFKRYVAAGEGKLHAALAKSLGDIYSQQLIESDPEIDFETVGRVIGGTILSFPFNPRTDYSVETGILVSNENGYFALIGEQVTYEFAGLASIVSVAEEATSDSVDDLDFEMF